MEPRHRPFAALLPGTVLLGLALLGIALPGTVLLTGCGTNDLRENLEEVPVPAVETESDEVRARLDEERQVFEQIREQPDVTAETLALAYGRMGMVYHAHNLFDPAAAAYRNAVRLTPDDFRWPHLLGRLHHREGDREAARAYFAQTLDLNPADVVALIFLGEVELELDDPEAADEHFRQALEMAPSAPAALAGIGRAALARDQPEVAVEWLETAMAAAPDALGLHQPLGLAYRRLGDEENARRHLEAGAGPLPRTQDPLMAQVNELGWSLRLFKVRATRAYEAGRMDLALREALRALEEEPEDTGMHLLAATALSRLGRGEEATPHFDEVLRLADDPRTLKDTHMNIALTRLQAEDPAGALAHLEEAVSLDAEDPQTRLALAATLQRLDRTEEALAHYREAVLLDPGSGPAHLGLTRGLAETGRWEEALTALEEAHQILPENPIIQAFLVRILAAAPEAEVRDGARALELAEELLGRGASPDLTELVAMARAEMGDFETAAQLQEEALGAAGQNTGFNLPLMEQRLELYRNGQAYRMPR